MAMPQSEQPEVGKTKARLSIGLVLLCWLLYVCLAATLNLMQVFINAQYAEPLTVTANGISNRKTEEVKVTLILLGGDQESKTPPEVPAFRDGRTLAWSWLSLWVDRIRLHATAEALKEITSLTVRLGSETHVFKSDDIRTWKRDAPEIWTLPNCKPESIVSMTIPLPKSSVALNMPRPLQLAIRAGIPGLILGTGFVLILLAAFKMREKLLFKLRKILSDDEAKDKVFSAEKSSHSKVFILLGFAVIIAAYALLNSVERYPFLQDDNFCQFLPVVMRSAETLASGKMPVWNPYQLLGAPTTTVGIYALTYAPTYISYFLAHAFGKDLATYEIFSMAHLCLGYFVTVWALNRFKISTQLAAAGGVCWVLSGWFLVAGRSQATFIPYVVFLPLLIDCLNTLIRHGGSLRWIGWSGILIGALFHAGHAELWVYTMMLLAVALLLMLATKNLSWKRFLHATSAFSLGLALAAPLLVLQKLETANLSRQGGSAWSVDLLPLLLPLGPLGYSGFSMGSINFKYGSEMYYAGTIFTATGIIVFALVTAFFIFDRRSFDRSVVRHNLWLFVGGLAFILCLGAPGILWSVLSYLPIFDKFRWSVKYIPFMQLLFIFGSARIIERSTAPQTQRIIFGGLCALMLFHVTMCRSSIYTFLDREYAPIDEHVTSEIYNGKRVFTVIPLRVPLKDVVQSLSLNFPTAYSVISASGYDTFVASRPQYEQFLRSLRTDTEASSRYGLNTLIVNDCVENPVTTGNPAEEVIEIVTGKLQLPLLKLEETAHLVDHRYGRRVYTLPTADALAFESNHPRAPLPYSLNQAGIKVNTSSIGASDTVIINFICWPWMQGFADGKPIPIKPDKWNRIQVTLPAQCRELLVEYRPPWTLSFAVAGIFFLLAVMIAFLAGRMREKTILV